MRREKFLNKRIDTYAEDLSPKTYKSLYNFRCETFKELFCFRREALMNRRLLGKKGLEEIDSLFEHYGLDFRVDYSTKIKLLDEQK